MFTWRFLHPQKLLICGTGGLVEKAPLQSTAVAAQTVLVMDSHPHWQLWWRIIRKEGNPLLSFISHCLTSESIFSLFLILIITCAQYLRNLILSSELVAVSLFLYGVAFDFASFQFWLWSAITWMIFFVATLYVYYTISKCKIDERWDLHVKLHMIIDILWPIVHCYILWK